MSIGVWQVVLVLLIVLIVFGAGKLPRVMGDVAKGVKNFKEGMRDDSSTQDDAEPKQISQNTIETGETIKKDEPAKS